MGYLGLAALYFFINALASKFYKAPRPVDNEYQHKFVILIPGYKEDQVIVEVAREATRQSYPRDKFDVVVIADSFQDITLKALEPLPVTVKIVAFEKSSKSKSINKTLSDLPEKQYDAVMILDADNVMKPDVLEKMNHALNSGYQAVQGHRLAKNMDTHFSRLDAISEEINNCIFRKGHRVLGLSSALIGSGMAFKFDVYKNYMATIDSYGEDKELEFKLLADKIRIEYLDDAWIYDEKVSLSKVFVKQRRRWLFNQFYYARYYFGAGLKQLFEGNFDYFDKMFQQLLPPRIMFIGLTTLLTGLSFIYNPETITIIWMLIFLLMFGAFLLAVPGKFWNGATLRAVFYLPKGFFLMLQSLSQLKEARKGFGATQHSVTNVNHKT
jgi:cellulose synthase/poly-beta-1,6-N-acetylglucosamine synthase-like glycosyltransferase